MDEKAADTFTIVKVSHLSALVRTGQKLGQGTFGAVYDVGNGAVMKVPLNNLSEDPDAMSEFSIQRWLSTHPNILPLTRMVYLKNAREEKFVAQLPAAIQWTVKVPRYDHSKRKTVNVRSFLIDRDADFIPQIPSILYQLLHGVAFMHSFGILHMDLKFDNILFLKEQGRFIPLIADFGLSISMFLQERQSMINTEEFITAPYRAPEAWGSKQLPMNTRLDVWSLGIMFLELLLFTHLPHMRPKSEWLYPVGYDSDDLTLNHNRLVQRAQKQIIRVKRHDPLVADLLEKMLAPVQQRPNARDLLKHEYFRGKNISPRPNDKLFCNSRHLCYRQAIRSCTQVYPFNHIATRKRYIHSIFKFLSHYRELKLNNVALAVYIFDRVAHTPGGDVQISSFKTMAFSITCAVMALMIINPRSGFDPIHIKEYWDMVYEIEAEEEYQNTSRDPGLHMAEVWKMITEILLRCKFGLHCVTLASIVDADAYEQKLYENRLTRRVIHYLCYHALYINLVKDFSLETLAQTILLMAKGEQPVDDIYISIVGKLLATKSSVTTFPKNWTYELENAPAPAAPAVAAAPAAPAAPASSASVLNSLIFKPASSFAAQMVQMVQQGGQGVSAAFMGRIDPTEQEDIPVRLQQNVAESEENKVKTPKVVIVRKPTNKMTGKQRRELRLQKRAARDADIQRRKKAHMERKARREAQGKRKSEEAAQKAKAQQAKVQKESVKNVSAAVPAVPYVPFALGVRKKKPPPHKHNLPNSFQKLQADPPPPPPITEEKKPQQSPTTKRLQIINKLRYQSAAQVNAFMRDLGAHNILSAVHVVQRERWNWDELTDALDKVANRNLDRIIAAWGPTKRNSLHDPRSPMTKRLHIMSVLQNKSTQEINQFITQLRKTGMVDSQVATKSAWNWDDFYHVLKRLSVAQLDRILASENKQDG